MNIGSYVISQTLRNLKNSRYKFFNIEENQWITFTILREGMKLKHYNRHNYTFFVKSNIQVKNLSTNKTNVEFFNLRFLGICHCVQTDRHLVKHGRSWSHRTT